MIQCDSILILWCNHLFLTLYDFAARIPVRLYVRSISKDFENLEDVPEIDTWDDVSYLNRPVEFLREEGNNLILKMYNIVLIIFVEKRFDFSAK